MAKLLKLRRGTTSQHSSFTGAEGEVTVDTDKDVVVVHDGSTAGGKPMQAEDADLTSLASCQTGGAAALAALTSTEIQILDGATVTTAELNILDGVTADKDELNILDGVTANKDELNILDGVTADKDELNILDGVTSTTAELNTLDGFTGDKDDLIYAKDLKATGVTATEFDYLDGVTSAIQTQLGTKAPLASPTFTGTVAIPNVANLETAVVANTAKVTNATHSGDVTGSGALTIAANSVDGSKLTDNIDIAGTLDVTGAAVFDSTGTFVNNVTIGANGAGNATANGKFIAGNIGGSDNTDTKIEVSDNGGSVNVNILANGTATFGQDLRVTHSGNAASDKLLRLGNINNSGTNSAHLFTAGAYYAGPTAVDGTGYKAKIDAGTGAATFAGTVITQSNAVGVIKALTDGATIAVDFNDSNNYSVTLAGNRTLGQPSNQTAGQSGSIFVTQDGTGSRTLAYHADYKWAGGTAPTLSTAANTVDRIDYIVAAANKIHAVASLAVA